jgi:FdhE protein
MSKAGELRPDPTMIGNVAEPPFVRLPDPTTLFSIRAERFKALSVVNELGPYLKFLGDLCDCQHRVQARLREPDMPAADVLARARQHSMPPLDRSHFTADAACDATLERLFSLAAEFEMPERAGAALDRARGATAQGRQDMVQAVLADAIPVEAFADHVYIAAGLQVHFARQAARLDAKSLLPVDDGVCPTCGGAPVASQIVGWTGSAGARFCACSLCATLWHVVRIKCTLCASTKGISYQEFEGSSGNVKAETCENCRGYVKILQQHKDPALDSVADDVATLGLDLLLRDEGYRRGAVNHFLLGY